jgi:hypothetical protein
VLINGGGRCPVTGQVLWKLNTTTLTEDEQNILVLQNNEKETKS